MSSDSWKPGEPPESVKRIVVKIPHEDYFVYFIAHKYNDMWNHNFYMSLWGKKIVDILNMVAPSEQWETRPYFWMEIPE